jgi:hypothetical protein
MGEEELDGAHVTVVRTMADQRDAIDCCSCGLPACHKVKDKIGAAICNSIQHHNRLHETHLGEKKSQQEKRSFRSLRPDAILASVDYGKEMHA